MRILGSAIVFSSSMLFGLLLYFQSRKELRYTEELLGVMRRIRELICVKRAPIQTVFSKLSGQYLQQEGFFEKLCKEKDLYRVCLEYPLPQRMTELINDFSSNIGKSSVKAQKEEFDYIITKTEEYIKELRRELPKKQKLYLTLPPFFGILLVIVFL